MSRTKKPKPVPLKKQRDPERAARLRRKALQLCAVCVLGALAVVGVRQLRRYVEREVVGTPGPLIVVMKNRPRWMTDGTVQQIVDAARPAGGHSAFDRQM